MRHVPVLVIIVLCGSVTGSVLAMVWQSVTP
jgi:hypothetical protein